MNDDLLYMSRSIWLAKLGAGYVAPNPMVGAVLVHEKKIIGEGYHRKYGEAHAEVSCINNAVDNGFANLIRQSVLYVSLEPCAHFGKTPPCADLIIASKIPKVVIGCVDPFKEVQGKGIQKMKEAGIEVTTGVLEDECRELNKRFFTFQTQHRPYIILKWAQTADGKIARNNGIKDAARLLISNPNTNRLVHKWRSEEASVLVGTNTALLDDPELTNRLWHGPSPLRLIIDMNLRLPASLKIFNDEAPAVIFNTKKHSDHFFNVALPARKTGVGFYRVTEDVSIIHQVVNALYHLKIQSVLVEGGARLLQSFIDENMWDEARIITNTDLQINDGLPAPQLSDYVLVSEEKILSDKVEYFKRISASSWSS